MNALYMGLKFKHVICHMITFHTLGIYALLMDTLEMLCQEVLQWGWKFTRITLELLSLIMSLLRWSSLSVPKKHFSHLKFEFSQPEWGRGDSLPGALKLDHLQPSEPILFWSFSIFWLSYWGAHFLYSPGRWESAILPTWVRQRGLSAWGIQNLLFAISVIQTGPASDCTVVEEIYFQINHSSINYSGSRLYGLRI